MKTIKILSAVMFSILLFSCGGKGNDKEEKSVNKKIENVVEDCNCSELSDEDEWDIGSLENPYIIKGVTKKDSKEIFTGVCIIKDQHDTIIRKNTYKNGWLVNAIVKEKTGNEYTIIKDINYENGQPNTYKYVKTEKNNIANFIFIKNYKQYKNKKGVIDYDITIFSNETFSLAATMHYLDGNEFSHKKPYSQPTSMPNSFKTIDGGWRLDKLSQEELYEILDGLKKEFPHFNYWKN
ncbi:hypothetical protein ABXT06_17525 [Flavobacterium sp. UW10123]|uniref:hypothetical protein n=1 Tax=Flavobacterium sp. UW10123 TaxID=3230800 RepID=UPI003395D54D